MFKDMEATIKRAQIEANKHPRLLLQLEDWFAINKLFNINLKAGTALFCIGFMQGMKAAKKPGEND